MDDDDTEGLVIGHINPESQEACSEEYSDEEEMPTDELSAAIDLSSKNKPLLLSEWDLAADRIIAPPVPVIDPKRDTNKSKCVRLKVLVLVGAPLRLVDLVLEKMCAACWFVGLLLVLIAVLFVSIAAYTYSHPTGQMYIVRHTTAKLNHTERHKLCFIVEADEKALEWSVWSSCDAKRCDADDGQYKRIERGYRHRNDSGYRRYRYASHCPSTVDWQHCRRICCPPNYSSPPGSTVCYNVERLSIADVTSRRASNISHSGQHFTADLIAPTAVGDVNYLMKLSNGSPIWTRFTDTNRPNLFSKSPYLREVNVHPDDQQSTNNNTIWCAYLYQDISSKQVTLRRADNCTGVMARIALQIIMSPNSLDGSYT